MPFGNISTFYLPSAANAGASQWGTDVRKLLSAADSASDTTTVTSHGTGGATVRTHDPYTLTTTDGVEANFGWAITPADMGSVAGALRFFPAGNHVLNVRMGHNGTVAATGTLTVSIFRVGNAASSRARTLLGSASASVAFPMSSGEVTAVCTVALPEVVFGADETVQYSSELSLTGVAVSGHTAFFTTGTKLGSGVVSRINTPVLGVLADTTGTATGLGEAAGSTGKVLGATATTTGSGIATGAGSARANTAGDAAGLGVAAAQMSAIASTAGAAAGLGDAAGLATSIGGMVGSAAGFGGAEGALGATGGMAGSATGLGAATGILGATGGATGAAAGASAATGLVAAISGATGSAAGLGDAEGIMGAVIGAVGTVEIGSDAPPPTPVVNIFRPFQIFEES